MINSEFIGHLHDEIFNFVNFNSSEFYPVIDLINFELFQKMKKYLSQYTYIDRDDVYVINSKLNEMHIDFCEKFALDERFDFQHPFFSLKFNINSILVQMNEHEICVSDPD